MSTPPTPQLGHGCLYFFLLVSSHVLLLVNSLFQGSFLAFWLKMFYSVLTYHCESVLIVVTTFICKLSSLSYVTAKLFFQLSSERRK